LSTVGLQSLATHWKDHAFKH